RATLGVTRRDDREQPGESVAQPPVGLDQHRLLAGMSRGAGNDGAVADRRAQLRQLVGIGGGGARAPLEVFPGEEGRGARSSRYRSACADDCARQRSKRRSSAPMVAGTRRQRLKDRSETRPLINTKGMPRSALVTIRFGQRSDSTKSARSGRQ